MGRHAFALLAVALCLGAGCLSGPSTVTNQSTTAPASTPLTGSTASTTASPPTTSVTTTRLTPDSMIPDDIVAVQSDSPTTHTVSVAVVDKDTDATVRAVNRTLSPDAEVAVSRDEPGAQHRRVVVRVDGTVVFDRTVYTAEQYWVTVHSATNVTVSKAVA